MLADSKEEDKRAQEMIVNWKVRVAAMRVSTNIHQDVLGCGGTASTGRIVAAATGSRQVGNLKREYLGGTNTHAQLNSYHVYCMYHTL